MILPRVRSPESHVVPAALALVIGVLACADPSPDRQQAGARAGSDAPAPAVSDTSLTGAAERIISFLRADADFPSELFADTVTLRVAPEGGGASRTLARHALADRSEWTVGGHRLAPPAAAGELTTRVGSHFNCMEVPLSTRSEALARFPHVGVLLRPPDTESCLQSWNMTLVFESGPRPAVTAVLYDQWEWRRAVAGLAGGGLLPSRPPEPPPGAAPVAASPEPPHLPDTPRTDRTG